MANLTIGGQTVKVDDAFLSMSPEQQQATVEEIARSLNPQQAPAEPAAPPQQAAPERPWWAGRNTIGDAIWQATGGGKESLDESYAGQGMSGINEGILNLAGAPVDLLGAGLNAGISGVNSMTGWSIPKFSSNSIGGSQSLKDLYTSLGGTIAPPSSDPGKQFVRRMGEEVGASLLPGLSVAAHSARPLATLTAGGAAAVGSGTGAAVAQQAFPGNPVAELGGQLLGSMTPGGIASTARRLTVPQASPALDALRQTKTAAYQAADALGARYSARGYDDMVNSIQAAATKDNISGIRHPRATSLIEEISNAPAGTAPTLTELDQLRQVVYRDLVKGPDEAERHFGQLIIDRIDDFIDHASGVQLAAGAGPDAASAITAAREANRVYRKTEIIDELLNAAELRTAATGSGGNINNAIRQRLATILTDPRKRRNFTASERAEIEEVIRQGRMEGILRLVGKLSPSGNGLMAMLGIGGTVANPMFAAAPIAGMGAKALADAGTVTRANNLRASIATGGSRAPQPFMSLAQREAAPGVVAGQLANNPANDNHTIAALERMGFTDLVQAIRSGRLSIGDAFNAAMTRRNAAMVLQ